MLTAATQDVRPVRHHRVELTHDVPVPRISGQRLVVLLRFADRRIDVSRLGGGQLTAFVAGLVGDPAGRAEHRVPAPGEIFSWINH